MPRRKVVLLSEPPPDPFGERLVPPQQLRLQLLGSQFHFEADSPRLLRIVRLAYAGLPPHRFSASMPALRVRLAHACATGSPESSARGEPPLIRPLAGPGMLCGVMDSSSFIALTPRQRAGLIVVSREMLRFPYHVRYEMLEFAVYVLAARAQALVPLHAGCVGRNGTGVLLVGPSGSGKTTLTLHCLLQGLEFLAEDSVLVRPSGLRATGISSFLHIRPDSLRFLPRGGRGIISGAALIRRRSGVEKFEVDLRRRPQYRLSPEPPRIRAVVFISPQSAGRNPLLSSLDEDALTRRLAATQKYAANQPGWSAFLKAVSTVPVFELRRGRHPLESVEAIERLLPARATGARGRA